MIYATNKINARSASYILEFSEKLETSMKNNEMQFILVPKLGNLEIITLHEPALYSSPSLLS